MYAAYGTIHLLTDAEHSRDNICFALHIVDNLFTTIITSQGVPTLNLLTQILIGGRIQRGMNGPPLTFHSKLPRHMATNTQHTHVDVKFSFMEE
jgi:hypothetical protein